MNSTSDTKRLAFLMDTIDGFEGVKMDKHEYAWQAALEEGREEPNPSDELEGFRRLIDAAMDKQGDKE